MRNIVNLLSGLILALVVNQQPASSQESINTALGIFTGREASGLFDHHSVAVHDLTYGIIRAAGPHLAWNIARVAEAPEINTIFASDLHNIGTLDPATGKFREIPYDPSLPKISSLGGIAWDSKRQRLVVASASHENNRLYAYTPATERWTKLSKLKYPLHGWVYLPDQDRLAAIVPNGIYGAYGLLVKFNSKGKPIKRIRLDRPIPTAYPGSLNLQVMLTDQGQLLIAEKQTVMNYPYSIFHLIDSNNGEVLPLAFLNYVPRQDD